MVRILYVSISLATVLVLSACGKALPVAEVQITFPPEKATSKVLKVANHIPLQPNNQTARPLSLQTKPLRPVLKTPKPPFPPPISTSLTTNQFLVTPKTVKGIYLTHSNFVSGNTLDQLSLLKTTPMNAVVVDMKDDFGRVWIDAKTRAQVTSMKNKNIYTIARIVVFKDPLAAKKHPDWTIKKVNGGQWTQSGVAWVDPTNAAVENYNINIAKRVAALGFSEIQFDYVRFPDSDLRSARFSLPNFKRADVIATFLRQATYALHQSHTTVSADVFGLVTTAKDDMGIGQIWEKISPNVDVISPMMYPSHYSKGIYGVTYPASNPHTVIEHGLRDALARNAALIKRGEKAGIIRPWLQDFDMKATYGPHEIATQIAAVREQKLNSYLFWNQANIYTKAGYVVK